MVSQGYYYLTLKEKEKIMNILGLITSSSTIPLHNPNQFPFEIITSTKGKTLIPRTIVTNISVYAIGIDVHLDSQRRCSNNIIRRASCEPSDMDLHNAASNGNLERAKEAVRQNRELLWKIDSPAGNIPLHIAVKNGHKEVATYLIKEYPQGCYTMNHSKISPLYLVVVQQPIDLSLIKTMFHELRSDEQLVHYLQQGKSILRPAIQNNNQGINIFLFIFYICDFLM